MTPSEDPNTASGPGSGTTSGDEDNGVRHLCRQLFRKELFKPPETFSREDDINSHVKKIEEYLRVTEITSDSDKVYVLVESLQQDLQKELKMTSDFQAKRKDYQFVKKRVLKLFKRKVAPITPFIRLLKTIQLRQQSVEDFARNIRVRAHDLIYDRTSEERETFMLECFSNGLRNKTLSTVLKLLKPETLDEAVKMIKKEEKELLDETTTEDAVLEMTCSNDCHMKIAELAKEIAALKSKINRMPFQQPNNIKMPQQSRAAKVPGRVFSRNITGNGNNGNVGLKCHNCNQTGHFANTCRLPKRCYNCGRTGHISRFCRQRRHVSYLQTDSSERVDEIKTEGTSVRSSAADADVDSEEFPPLTVTNRFMNLEDECTLISDGEEVYMAETPIPRPRRTKVVKKSCPTLIDKQVAFIEGKGPKPKPENVEKLECEVKKKENLVFYNKPVVKCRLNGERVNTLMDSGATCNLLAKEVFDSMSEKDGCRLHETNNRISCANNTNLNCLGEVSLHFSLAGMTILMKFFIVEGLRNCQAIVGLRAMKKMGIRFDFGNDCVILNDIIIPFESHVSPATTVRREGNGISLN